MDSLGFDRLDGFANIVPFPRSELVAFEGGTIIAQRRLGETLLGVSLRKVNLVINGGETRLFCIGDESLQGMRPRRCNH